MKQDLEGLIFGVVTGDVVASSRLGARERVLLRDKLHHASEAVRGDFEEAIRAPVDTFSGDKLQMVLWQPSRALDAALYLRAFLRAEIGEVSVDAKMSIGIGSVLILPATRVSDGDGQAFWYSGRGLEGLRGAHRMAFAFPAAEQAEKALAATVLLVDRLALNWTPLQARAVLGALQGLTQTEIGRVHWAPQISQQAVSRHLEAAGWPALEPALELFRESIQEEVIRQRNKVVLAAHKPS